MENVRHILNRIHPINDEEWDYFKGKFFKRSFPGKTIIIQSGQVESSLYFIEEGVLRAWFEKDDTEKTFDFAFENNFYSAYSSFLTRTPCSYNIESITGMIIWEISYNDLQDIYKNTSVGNIFGKAAAEELFLSKCKKEFSLLFKSAQQRYRDLFDEEPRLIREIPLKYIASYIGITPQALSRIRRRIS
ncbi:MAG TPA: Crp/Fnr family transcriptional regulator [Bacteroidales bacterium]|nr:Crp/Fnr family transcriptional regulator [Bacteroidales bacterium]